jgi:hypothetical protein
LQGKASHSNVQPNKAYKAMQSKVKQRKQRMKRKIKAEQIKKWAQSVKYINEKILMKYLYLFSREHNNIAMHSTAQHNTQIESKEKQSKAKERIAKKKIKAKILEESHSKAQENKANQSKARQIKSKHGKYTQRKATHTNLKQNKAN